MENIYKISAAEICSVYHTVKHSLSYNSMDCYHKLLPIMLCDSNIVKKFACGRTKCEAIVCEILAKESQRELFKNLRDDCIYFSISTDASNKGNRKMFPICVRYFNTEKGIQNKLLDFVESNNETVDQITNVLCTTLEKCNLPLAHISAYGADNANVNFGSNRSVYTNLTSKNKNIIKANYSMHILHNMCKFACDKLDIDVETLISKIYSHFSHSAKRRSELIDIFEITEIEWAELLRHVHTRFLSLSPALGRIIKVWPAIKSYFLASDNCPKVIEKIFESEEEEARNLTYLNFVHNVMSSFEILMKEGQSNELAVTEMHTKLCLFRIRLQLRLQDNFYGFQAKQLINKLEDSQRNKAMIDFKSFYENCLQYLEKRYDFSPENLFNKLDFVNIKETISYESLENAVILLNMTEEISMDQLYEEFCLIKPSVEVLMKNTNELAANKWKQLFQLFPKKDVKNAFKLISYILSIPTSNCFVERVFSQINLKWSDVRNRCSVQLIKSELLVQFNFDMSCKEFYNHIREEKDILTQLKLSDKYK